MLKYNEFLEIINNIADNTHYLKMSDSAYIENLYNLLCYLSKYISSKNIEDIINNKLQIKLKKFDENQYIQSACELSAMSIIENLIDKTEFTYENKITPPKDVDFSVKHKNIQYNIEVKCPSYSIPTTFEKKNQIELKLLNRLPLKRDKEKLFNEIKHKLPNHLKVIESKNLDNTMKDFLLSSQAKFLDADSSSSNILIVCCNDEIDMLNWRYYLFDDTNGFFTHKSQISHTQFDRVDYILFTNLFNMHYNHNKKTQLNSWDISNSFSLLYYNNFSKKNITKYDYLIVSNLLPNKGIEFEDYLYNDDLPKGETSYFFKKKVLGISFFLEKYYPNHKYFNKE